MVTDDLTTAGAGVVDRDTACSPPGVPETTNDAIAALGASLAVLSSSVARRELELNRLFEQIARERNVLLDTVLGRLFDAFIAVIPFDTLECAFLSDDGQHAVSYWKRCGGEPEHPSWAAALDGSRLRDALGHRQPIVIDDLVADGAAGSGVVPEQHLAAQGARALLACPLAADGSSLGFLFFTSRVPAAFTPAHASAFQRAAAQVSVVVQKTRAYGEGLQGSRALIRETNRLRRVATTDALTGVLNRRALDDRLAAAWGRVEQEGVPFGLIFCDLDFFKRVNDTHGHAIGDRVLAQAATALARGLRAGDAFGRYGGEEFLAIVDSSDLETLARVTRRLRLLVAAGVSEGVRVTASFGVASSDGFTSLPELVCAADCALYEAKRLGRNRCVLAASGTELVLLPDGER